MSAANWDGKNPAEIIADVTALLADLPSMPDPLELLMPLSAYNRWAAEAEDQLDRAFRRKEPWAAGPMLERIASKAAAEMFAFSREPRP